MKKMNALSVIALFLIFLGGLGAILLTVGQSLSSQKDKEDIIGTTKEENKILKEQITELQNERNKLSQTLETRDSRIQEQSKNIESLSTKLVEKSEYIEKYVSGNGVYPHVELKTLPNYRKGEPIFENITFDIKNSFEFPVYNVTVVIFDYVQLLSKIHINKNPNTGKNINSIKKSDYFSCQVLNFKENEIPPKEYVRDSGTYPLKNSSFFITIHTRGKTVIQKMIIYVLKDKFDIISQIIDPKSGEILKDCDYVGLPPNIKIEMKATLDSIPNSLNYMLIE